MEEILEREWKGMFLRNAVAHARLHSHLSSYDRILSTSLLSHRIPPPLWLPDPPSPSPSLYPHVLGPQTSSLQPQQPAVVLASHRDAGLEMPNGHKHEQADNDERPVCANGIPNTITKYKEDKKIVWHGTPFEERVEKALSDEKLFPRNQGQI